MIEIITNTKKKLNLIEKVCIYFKLKRLSCYKSGKEKIRNNQYLAIKFIKPMCLKQ